jgi:hypothetical protein
MLPSPEGETGGDDDADGSEMNSHPVVQAFKHWGVATQNLQIIGTLAPELMAPLHDMITLMNQMLPAWAASKLSGNGSGAMAQLGGAGAPSLGSLAGTSSMGPPSMPGGGGAGISGAGAVPPGAGAPMMGAPM